MKKLPFIYITHDSAQYSSGMVFDSKGNFSFAIDSHEVPDFIQVNTGKYIVINPMEKSIFKNIQEELSIRSIGKYFNNIFRENSPVIDSAEVFSDIFSKVIGNFSFINKNVLDYGSGNGKYLSIFKNSNYFGYDINISDEKIIDIEKRDFDFVICNFVLEHVANPFVELKNLISYLKIGGIFIVSIPALTFKEFAKYYFFRKNIHLPIFHLRTFSVSNFKGCLSFISLLKVFKRGKIRLLQTVSVNSYRNHPILFKYKPFNNFGNQIIIIGERVA